MAVKPGAFPYDIDNLLGGAVRILFADPDDAGDPGIPAGIEDVIDMRYPYDAVTGWTDLGATKESFSYSRSFDTEGWEIQQEAGNVIEEVTSIERTIELSVAEFRPQTLAMLENAPSAGLSAITAGAGRGAQDVVAFGGFQSPKRYRFAFVSRRSTASGIVTETGTTRTRGRFFLGVLYQAQIAADDMTIEQAKGALTASGVTFTSFPDAAAPAEEEYGAWYDEHAGAVAAPS